MKSSGTPVPRGDAAQAHCGGPSVDCCNRARALPLLHERAVTGWGTSGLTLEIASQLTDRDATVTGIFEALRP